MVLGLALCVLQGGIWLNSTAHARSETEKANRLSEHRPNEIPGIAGTLLLIAAGVLLSLRPSETTE